MPKAGADREEYFPLIEKRYGEKMSYWFTRMKEVEGKKYPEQIAFLKENYGFSQAHANALVMYCRGSKSAAKFASYAEYLASEDPVKQKTIKKIFKSIQSEFPELELVMAWNQPMLRYEGQYIFGISTTKSYILIAPWSKDVLAAFADRLSEYPVNKKTIEIPADWKVDSALLCDIASARLKEVKKALKTTLKATLKAKATPATKSVKRPVKKVVKKPAKKAATKR